MKEINRLSVVVKGENDARIQIIGLLESRTLDYENVIFLFCNEEFLPSKSNFIDISITPNRPDCLGVRGIARDVAASGFGRLKYFKKKKNK